MQPFPPLRLLTTFEAIARHGSMRLAAARLNVTQPAVSQSLKALEAHVGTALLDRGTRPAQLTEAGELLARAVRDGLGQISAALEDIRALSGQDGGQVSVSCTLGMATYWLMPRLPDFYAAHPDITVNVQAPSTDLPYLSPGIDVAIRYGTGSWHEGTTMKLFDERVCPVAAPSLLERLQAEKVGLDRAPLIHVRSPHNQHWAGWEDYLTACGIQRNRSSGQTFNNYVQAAQAVLDGRGVMLGWRSIAQGAVRDGALREWPDATVDLGTAYYVTANTRRASTAQTFLDWLVETVGTVHPPSR
ncbi:MAG: LysR family transcriptional regulator [Rhodobacteraceae bacterium]|mgnify:CR=1 FL=1|jgi:LysR family glycine cleavage system transcriptional activator|uniref:Transcriptional regulator n=1 Tax=Salipiger profundus TaxID=1229727 RepID=A0A1U7D979_9RHOB|nr:MULTISPECIES: LysR substrate-binding domain-containing protein [Salipiger]APX24662.1 transcriptional regulator [Salipiger profundus]MAB06450.1 LysR family transcriptional regulator [Paracoccaceae bacterium]GFZ96892.1 LysR family transcriptional regulator [Salipiger profundus]SFB79849.1 transcriptional regulator, LysR family [Salipiger profundus]